MTLPSRINLVTLGVKDVAASTAFYERLGWTKSKASNEQVTFFHSNGTVLGLFDRQSLADDAHVINAEDGFGGFTLAQNFDSDSEVDLAFSHAIACGAVALKNRKKCFGADTPDTSLIPMRTSGNWHTIHLCLSAPKAT